MDKVSQPTRRPSEEKVLERFCLKNSIKSLLNKCKLQFFQRLMTCLGFHKYGKNQHVTQTEPFLSTLIKIQVP